MTKHFAATCDVCPVTFTAKSRIQIREMLFDHLDSHYVINASVNNNRKAIQAVLELHVAEGESGMCVECGKYPMPCPTRRAIAMAQDE